jgi:DNA-directed RNA polymerase subunit RPC12/RpoP
MVADMKPPQCPECESKRLQLVFLDNRYKTYDCLDCGTDFRKCRLWVRTTLLLFSIFAVFLLWHIVSLIPLGVL